MKSNVISSIGEQNFNKIMCTQTLLRKLVRENNVVVLTFILPSMGKNNRNIENCDIIIHYFSLLSSPSPSFQNTVQKKKIVLSSIFFSVLSKALTKIKVKEKGLAIFESCRCVIQLLLCTLVCT